MNNELMHQLYGGEISDYHKKNDIPLVFDNGIDNQTSQDIEQIYNTQIKGKPSIDTTGLYNTNITPPIERDPYYDKIGADLTATLNAISKQIGLDVEPSSNTVTRRAITIQNQTNNDIAAANDNVLQALRELKDLNAV